MDYDTLFEKRNKLISRSPLAVYFPKPHQVYVGRKKDGKKIFDDVLISRRAPNTIDRSLDVIRSHTSLGGIQKEAFDVLFTIDSPDSTNGTRIFPLDWKDYVVNPKTGKGDISYLRGKLCEQIMRISLAEQLRRVQKTDHLFSFKRWKGPMGKVIRRNADYTAQFDYRNAVLVKKRNSHRRTEAEHDGIFEYWIGKKKPARPNSQGIVICEAKTSGIGHIGCHNEEQKKETYDQFIAPYRSLYPNTNLTFLLYGPKGQIFYEPKRRENIIGILKDEYHDATSFMLENHVGFLTMESNFTIQKLNGISKSILSCRELVQNEIDKPSTNNAQIFYTNAGERVIRVDGITQEFLGSKGEVLYRNPKMEKALK